MARDGIRVRAPVAVVSALVSSMLAISAGAQGTTFVVDVTGDAVDDDPGDGLCAIAISGSCTLRAAIQEANALPGQQKVELGAGVHPIALGGTDEDAGATGDFDVTDDLLIAGLSTSASIVDGSSHDRVFEVADGVFFEVVDLTIRHGNIVGHHGGGIYAGPDTFVVTARVTFSENVAQAVDCDPFTCGGGGAAIALQSQNPATGSTLLMIQSRFVENQGGGILYAVNAVAQLADVTMADNLGSVLYAVDTETTIDRASIHGNRADLGILRLSDDEPTRIRDSTISRNFSLGSIVSAPGPLTLRNVTVAENGASYTFDVGGALQIQNSVVTDFLMVELCHASGGGSVVSLGHNVDSDGSCTSLGSDRTVADARLGPLADNGGGTLSHLPLAGSPLIDAAEDADCSDLDQRRVDRPQDGNGDGAAHCDIGAVEVPEPAGSALLASAIASLVALRWSEHVRAPRASDRGRSAGAGRRASGGATNATRSDSLRSRALASA